MSQHQEPPKHVPTPEQERIVTAVRRGIGRLMVVARAGAAKTTTLTWCAREIRSGGIALAFNRGIAREMAQALPRRFRASTLNAQGMRVLTRNGTRPWTIEATKIPRLLAEAASNAREADRGRLWARYDEMLSHLRRAQCEGWLPDKRARAPWDSLPGIDDQTMRASVQWEATPLELATMTRVGRESWRLAVEEGCIDLTDQLLLPAACDLDVRHERAVLIDEAQDLSRVDHALTMKMIGSSTQVIAVGDPFQAIYGFRGAMEGSMQTLKRMHRLRTGRLSTTFRCATEIVREAIKREPRVHDLRARDGAPRGEVRDAGVVDPLTLPAGVTVLCRNNAPLVKLCIARIDAGHPVLMRNTATLRAARETLRHIENQGHTERGQAIAAIDQWEEEALIEARTEGRRRAIADQAETLKALLRNGKASVADALRTVDRTLSPDHDPAAVQLSTIHGAKGLEWPEVWWLDQQLCKPDEEPQDAHLIYVAITRAKERLVYCRSKEPETHLQRVLERVR